MVSEEKRIDVFPFVWYGNQGSAWNFIDCTNLKGDQGTFQLSVVKKKPSDFEGNVDSLHLLTVDRRQTTAACRHGILNEIKIKY